MDVHDSQHPSFTFMKVMLPTYLATTTPTVILGDKDSLRLAKLVFLQKDLSPEIMVLPFTWDSLLENMRTARCSHQAALSMNGPSQVPSQVLAAAHIDHELATQLRV